MSTSARSAKTSKPTFACSECGWSTIKWVGRCGECQAWGSVAEVGVRTARTAIASVSTAAPSITEVDASVAVATPTGIGELDRVLGGGLVPGSVILVAGEPGIGKSTLLLQAAASVAQAQGTSLYITGEESAAQVRARAGRVDALEKQLHLCATTDLGEVLGQIEAINPRVLVIDSVQTIASGQIDSSAGNVSQIREVAAAIIQAAKARNIATFLVGHVTKDGSIAGPRLLEHLVDVVVTFEGERHSRLRMVRAVKNRYGPTDEVGCFDLADSGLTGLADISGLFLSGQEVSVPGTCVTIAVEGRRPLPVEVQSLVAPSGAASPRRASHGLDASRVNMIVAVLDRRAGAPIRSSDTYVSTVAGLRVSEPASDLAVALAVAGSVLDRAIPRTTVAIGEVGLSGELRPVQALGRRLAEAARLGFETAYVPQVGATEAPHPAGLRVIPVPDVASAVRLALPEQRNAR